MGKGEYLFSETTGLIIKSFYKVYNVLGHGFSKDIYKNALLVEFANMGLGTEQDKPVKILYGGKEIGEHRLEIVVNGCVLVETEAFDKLSLENDDRKIYNHLKASGLKVGLILNFGKKAEICRREFLG